MFNRDKWNEILEALSANPFRTLITAFGVFWGIFILVILLSASQGLQNGIKRQMGGLSTNTMFMWANTTSKPYKGLPQGRAFNYKNGDVEAIKRNVEGLMYVSPRNQLGGFRGSNNVVRGTKTGAYNVYGDYPEFILQQPMEMLQGRFINYGDIENKRKVAVIGEGVIRELYAPDEKVLGSYIKVQGVNFMVVGVYKSISNIGGDKEESQKQLFMPFTTFQQAFNYGDIVGWMAITAVDDTPITDIKENIFDILKQRHSIDPKDDRAIGHFDLYQEFKKINGLFSILTAVSYIVGIFILGSGIIGIVNIMLIIVKERTQEIGIRRALGATPATIIKQILTESVVLSVIAGMAGIIFASLVLAGINFALDKAPNANEIPIVNPSVHLGVVVIALLILVIAGLLAGLIPAITAIKVKPIDALRTE
ncbi:ABC transporter permease [Flavobacterium sp. xlx-214]|uniref:ABC transporter permease n=1 Tax=unclassified Flavobacterium TaxID=196869 RepID=UPI0013D33966|nr:MULTISPECIES: ABC transporter permease [unclassified Flavobacterium]MBA5792216.1 ABC transporter permease [Flavobacterium sp. xlx-221]QMI84458.1 ABC transporter permease [Flavobacterium sp. xlx-214]